MTTTTTTKPVFMLTGDSLVSFVNEQMELVNRGEITRTDMIKEAGYEYDNGNAMYAKFYTELLNAKGIKPATDTDVVEADYDDLEDDTKELYDHVDGEFGEKWSHGQVMEFIEELRDIDIQTKDVFEESYYGRYDSLKEWAQNVYEYEMSEDNPLFGFIDWDDVARELRYDFDVVEYDWDCFIFRK